MTPHDDVPIDGGPNERARPSGFLRVVVCGAIGPHKGSLVLRSMAAIIQRKRLKIKLHVVGYTDIDDDLRKLGVEITGAYTSEAEAAAEIRKIQPDLFLIPSIWPETYCFSLSIGITLGVPPVVFDLGAQAERVGALGWGHVIDARLINAPEQVIDEILDLDVDRLWRARNESLDISHEVEPVAVEAVVDFPEALAG